MPVVDAHLHVWRAVAGGTAGTATAAGSAEDVPIARAVAVLNQHGVERAVLVQPVFPGDDNAYVADCAARDPDRLAAVCVVDPRTAGAADRLEHWVAERGCRGLRLRPRLPSESAVFGDPSTFPLWERAGTLGVVVNVLANPGHLPTLAALAERFPSVAIVVDHLAHPRTSDGPRSAGLQCLLDLARHPDVFVKLSGYHHFTDQPFPYASCADIIRAVYDRYGPERLLWGSDFPHVERHCGYARSLELVQHQLPFAADAERGLILGGNAERLYWRRHAATPAGHIPTA